MLVETEPVKLHKVKIARPVRVIALVHRVSVAKTILAKPSQHAETALVIVRAAKTARPVLRIAPVLRENNARPRCAALSKTAAIRRVMPQQAKTAELAHKTVPVRQANCAPTTLVRSPPRLVVTTLVTLRKAKIARLVLVIVLAPQDKSAPQGLVSQSTTAETGRVKLYAAKTAGLVLPIVLVHKGSNAKTTLVLR